MANCPGSGKDPMNSMGTCPFCKKPQKVRRGRVQPHGMTNESWGRR